VIGRRRRNAKQQEWERRISALERYWSALPVPARRIPCFKHLTDSELEELESVLRRRQERICRAEDDDLVFSLGEAITRRMTVR
jgi:hypothetical protein